jgi:hypothetical protein
MLDSLQEVNEESEAKLVVVSVWRGAAGIDGAPVNCSRWYSHREEKEEGDGGGGARWEGRGGARVSVAR